MLNAPIDNERALARLWDEIMNTIWRKTLKVTLTAIRQVAMAPLSRGVPFPVHGAVMEELESDVDVPNITVYDDQTSHAVSTTPVLRVCTCHVIKK
jgi:hypothetical protein